MTWKSFRQSRKSRLSVFSHLRSSICWIPENATRHPSPRCKILSLHIVAQIHLRGGNQSSLLLWVPPLKYRQVLVWNSSSDNVSWRCLLTPILSPPVCDFWRDWIGIECWLNRNLGYCVNRSKVDSWQIWPEPLYNTGIGDKLIFYGFSWPFTPGLWWILVCSSRRNNATWWSSLPAHLMANSRKWLADVEGCKVENLHVIYGLI